MTTGTNNMSLQQSELLQMDFICLFLSFVTALSIFYGRYGAHPSALGDFILYCLLPPYSPSCIFQL